MSLGGLSEYFRGMLEQALLATPGIVDEQRELVVQTPNGELHIALPLTFSDYVLDPGPYREIIQLLKLRTEQLERQNQETADTNDLELPELDP